jgi:hypothetical protein
LASRSTWIDVGTGWELCQFSKSAASGPALVVYFHPSFKDNVSFGVAMMKSE